MNEELKKAIERNNNVDNFAIFITDLLAIDPVTLKFETLDFSVSKCFPEARTIIIDKNKLKDSLAMQITIAHELRHQYQHDCIEGEIENEPKYIINKFRKCFDKYISLGHDGYEKQYIEIDADSFAQVVLCALYDFQIQTTGIWDKKLVENLLKDFTIEEIQQVASECDIAFIG